jgi:hypothetical protein
MFILCPIFYSRFHPPAAFPVVDLARLPAKAASPKSDTDSEGDDDESDF